MHPSPVIPPTHEPASAKLRAGEALRATLTLGCSCALVVLPVAAVERGLIWLWSGSQQATSGRLVAPFDIDPVRWLLISALGSMMSLLLAPWMVERLRSPSARRLPRARSMLRGWPTAALVMLIAHAPFLLENVMKSGRTRSEAMQMPFILISFAGLMLALWLNARLDITPLVIAVEGRTGFKAVQRTWSLTRGYGFRILLLKALLTVPSFFAVMAVFFARVEGDAARKAWFEAIFVAMSPLELALDVVVFDAIQRGAAAEAPVAASLSAT